MPSRRSSWKMCVQLIPPTSTVGDWRFAALRPEPGRKKRSRFDKQFCRACGRRDRARAQVRRKELIDKTASVITPMILFDDWPGNEIAVSTLAVATFLRGAKKIDSSRFGVIIPDSLLRFAGRKTLRLPCDRQPRLDDPPGVGFREPPQNHLDRHRGGHGGLS